MTNHSHLIKNSLGIKCESFIKEFKMSICCAICCDIFKSEDPVNMEPVAIIKCRHVFHKQCINKCLASSKKCPICRMDLSAGDIKYNRIHFSYSPSSVIINNLLKEIEDLKRGNLDANKRYLAENIALKTSVTEMENKVKAEKRKFQHFKDDIHLKASVIVRLCRNNDTPPPQ